MAADTISFPRFASVEKEITPCRSTRKNNGPFRATQLWNDVISHLKQNVEVKRRRVKMKTYDQCFTGQDATDVVLQHLVEARSHFANKEISRDKAIKLCQLMLDNCVFEPVKPHVPMETQVTFEDSTNKCYRFLDDDCAKENKYIDENMDFGDGTPRLHCDLEPDLSDSSIIGNPMALEKRGQIVQEILDITGSWKRYSSDCLKRKLTPARLFNKRVSLPDCKASSTIPDFRINHIPPAVEEEVWHEVALSQLLMLVDVPVLDAILSYESTRKASGSSSGDKNTVGVSNLAFKRWESVTSLFSEKAEDDPWVEAAMDCLECHPKGLDMLDLSLTEETNLTQKLRLYQCIADHYKELSEPLWSEKFVDLHLPLLNLLMQGKRDVALRAVQLSVLLLPTQLREEMRRLLLFMKYAAESEADSEAGAVQLSSMEDNRRLISRTFSKCVIRNKIMTPHQAEQLVMFMADHADKLLDTPTDVEDLVLAKLQMIGRGLPKAVAAEPAYCKRVSEDEFRKQQQDGTERALVELINAILDDTKMALKEKKQRLKQLQKHHPQLYMRHFGDML